MGARLSARGADRFPPLVIQGGGLEPIRHDLEIASAQVASCVLFAGLQANGETRVTIPGPARDHTERMLQSLGAPLEIESLPNGGRRVMVLGPATLAPAHVRVPGDFSSAAFFLAAAAARPGASVTATGVNLNPTRTGLLDVLQEMGADISRDNLRDESGEPVGDVTVTGPERLRGIAIPTKWVPRLLDEVPAWIIAAARAEGCSTLSGASELRVKESDRIAVLVRNLNSLGVRASERPDGLEITGGPVTGGVVRSEHDHRIAMAFAVLATSSNGEVKVVETEHIVTSYPGFVRTLCELGGDATERDIDA
jgi:3-phosphoshikimate 1-carboxyvinyltransferase